MNLKIEISVIICCYNSEKYLSATLESLLNQTFKDFELIIINDGSIDKTISIIEDFEERFSNITVVDQANHGLNESRNLGLELVDQNSKYVVFFDSDDLFSIDLLSCLHKEISSDDNLIAVFSPYLKFDDKNNYSSPGFGGFFEIKNCLPIKSDRLSFVYFDILTGIVPAIEPACIYNINALIEIGGWDTKNFPKGKTNGELIPLQLSLKKKGSLRLTENSCYYYRQHVQQITQNIGFDNRRASRIKDELFFLEFAPFTRFVIRLFLNAFINLINIKGSYKHILRHEISKIPKLFFSYATNQIIVLMLMLLKGREIKNILFV